MKILNKLRFGFWTGLYVLLSMTGFSQSTVRVMQIHYKDGANAEIPIGLIDSITFGYSSGNNTGPIFFDSVFSNEVLARAFQMASVEWTPLRPVPKRGGGFYDADVTVTGVPYSSVKEINTYLFQDVSYHTFMTAVHNPMSVFYTENISLPPYHGLNCAPYYGAVCSSSVMWALGINLPYYANQIINLPDMIQLEHQIIDSLRVCDIIWRSGHVQMIYDLEYRADTLYKIRTFETSGEGSHIRDFTKAQFVNMWNNSGYVGYRYAKLIYSSTPVVFQNWESIAYNDALCPSKGDRAVYRTTDTITINVFDSSYDHIVLTKGPSLISSDSYNGDVYQYYDLPSGIYSVFLQRDNEKTARVSFEIVDVDVSYELCDDGESMDIYFNSSAKPECAMLCKQSGTSLYYPISDIDRWNGYITVPASSDPEYCYCKVIFKGEYGRIINLPIRVE